MDASRVGNTQPAPAAGDRHIHSDFFGYSSLSGRQRTAIPYFDGIASATLRLCLYSSLESVIEQNKESYYLALHQTQGTLRAESPNWQPWLLFFLRTLHQQVQRLKKKVERERLLLAALPELAVQIVEHVRQHGRVTLKEMHLLTGASRNTLKEHFRRLTAAGQLEMQGKGRGVWYRLK